MNERPSPLSGYFALAEVQLKTVFAYRSAVAAGLAIVVLRIALLNAVWTAAYSARQTVGGTSLPDVLTLITLGNLQLFLMRPMLLGYLQQRIHEGQIALDLVRPIPMLGQLFAQQVGATVGLVPVVALGTVVAMLFGTLTGPASAAAAVAYLVSLGLAYVISALMGLLLGLIAFWTVRTIGVGAIYEFATQFFGGALVPLVLFPPGLRAISDALPFRAQVSIPVSIYTGSVTGAGDLLSALALQLLWVTLLIAIIATAWRYVRRVITVHAG